MKDHFEELIRTIENNAVDNIVTITNVKLWAESWRAERESDMLNEPLNPIQKIVWNERHDKIFEHPIPGVNQPIQNEEE